MAEREDEPSVGFWVGALLLEAKLVADDRPDIRGALRHFVWRREQIQAALEAEGEGAPAQGGPRGRYCLCLLYRNEFIVEAALPIGSRVGSLKAFIALHEQGLEASQFIIYSDGLELRNEQELEPPDHYVGEKELWVIASPERTWRSLIRGWGERDEARLALEELAEQPFGRSDSALVGATPEFYDLVATLVGLKRNADQRFFRRIVQLVTNCYDLVYPVLYFVLDWVRRHPRWLPPPPPPPAVALAPMEAAAAPELEPEVGPGLFAGRGGEDPEGRRAPAASCLLLVEDEIARGHSRSSSTTEATMDRTSSSASIPSPVPVNE